MVTTWTRRRAAQARPGAIPLASAARVGLRWLGRAEVAAVALFLEAEPALLDGADPLIDPDQVIHGVFQHSKGVRRALAAFVVRDALGLVLGPRRQLDGGRVLHAAASALIARELRLARLGHQRSELLKRLRAQVADRRSDRLDVNDTLV